MSATDVLRRMLDERCIEHFDHENGEPLRDLSEAGTDPATSWRMGGANVCAVPNKHGTFDLWIDNCTPEQAIAATVGPTLDHDLQQALNFMRIWITDDAHLGESEISYELEKAEGLCNLEAIEQAIAATVGGYGITFAPTLDRPPETMVGETVYDGEGNAIGWITSARIKEVAE